MPPTKKRPDKHQKTERRLQNQKKYEIQRKKRVRVSHDEIERLRGCEKSLNELRSRESAESKKIKVEKGPAEVQVLQDLIERGRRIVGKAESGACCREKELCIKQLADENQRLKAKIKDLEMVCALRRCPQDQEIEKWLQPHQGAWLWSPMIKDAMLVDSQGCLI